MINDNDVKVNIITIDFFNDLDDNEEDTGNETKNQKATKNVLKKLCDLSDNVKVFNNKMASVIAKQFRKKRVTPVCKYRGPLILTPNLYIDICAYTKTSKVHIPSLKKYSLATEYCKIIFNV
jgi:hypoxanthine-guanine phosphoribosyltransferase